MTGEAETGKTTMTIKIKALLQPHQYKICTPTHKSSLLYDDSQTVYSLFNINQHKHTYLKRAVDKLKNEGVEYTLIDEVSYQVRSLRSFVILKDLSN